MDAAPTRFEVTVGTLVSEAALAAFSVPVRPTAVLRSTVYRFRIADRDLTEVLHLLTERDVQVLEIRRCPEPRSRPPREAGEANRLRAPAAGGVVVPLVRRPRPWRPGVEPRGGHSTG